MSSNIEKAIKDFGRLIRSNGLQVSQYAVELPLYKNSQNPGIIVLSCCDSRVPDSSIGISQPNQAFSIKSIGNQIETTKGSIAYGLSHLTPYLVIVGHTGCGAIKGASGDFSGENEHTRNDLSLLVYSIEEGRKKATSGLNESQMQAFFSQSNVDYQVEMTKQIFGHIPGLTVIGCMFDFHNIYGNVPGQIYIVNVDGKRNISEIKTHPFISSLPGTIVSRIKRI